MRKEQTFDDSAIWRKSSSCLVSVVYGDFA